MFRIQALRGEGDLTLTAIAGTAECARAVGVTFTVWVPKSYDVKIKTESGDIDIPKMKGRFSAHTSDGKISVDCDTSDLDVEVEDHTGEGSVAEPADAGEPDQPVEPEAGGDDGKPAAPPTPSRGNDRLER
jgi:hypothetical protein